MLTNGRVRPKKFAQLLTAIRDDEPRPEECRVSRSFGRTQYFLEVPNDVLEFREIFRRRHD